jgi:hypothetical protein
VQTIAISKGAPLHGIRQNSLFIKLEFMAVTAQTYFWRSDLAFLLFNPSFENVYLTPRLAAGS